MLRLLLMRHAKAEPALAGLPDFARPLAERGIAASHAIGHHLADHGLVPRFILCSSSSRTRETLAGILPFFELDATVSIRRALYDADATQVLDAIRAVADRPGPLMVIGHNPALEGLARVLSGSGNADCRARLREHYPTGAVSVIDFDAPSWAQVGPGEGRLVAFLRPKALDTPPQISR